LEYPKLTGSSSRFFVLLALALFPKLSRSHLAKTKVIILGSNSSTEYIEKIHDATKIYWDKTRGILSKKNPFEWTQKYEGRYLQRVAEIHSRTPFLWEIEGIADKPPENRSDIA